MITNTLFRRAAENVAGEPVSIEPDGSVWADSDGRVIDRDLITAEYERLIAAEQAAADARRSGLAKLAQASGLTADELSALGLGS